MTHKVKNKGLENYEKIHISNIKYGLSIDKDKFTYIPLA